jgi:biopolymer transport protein ExbB/TolQ
VRHAAFWVTLWHGWPQLFMIILAIYALWWLWPRLVGAYLDREAVREAQRDRQASERGGNQPAKSDSEATQEGVPIRYRRPLPNRVYEKGTMELRDRGGERAAAWRAEIDAHAARLKALGWPIRLSAGLIPMFGFIGTVLGIMEALGRSDVIVRASSVTDQAAAVLDVAGALGLAFGTTAIALALGIVLRLLLGLAEGWEDEWTTSMDTEIAPWAEPAARK